MPICAILLCSGGRAGGVFGNKVSTPAEMLSLTNTGVSGQKDRIHTCKDSYLFRKQKNSKETQQIEVNQNKELGKRYIRNR